MKRILFLSLAACVLYFLGISQATAQYKNYLDQPYLETTARADTLVTPDRIYLDILIQESDTKGRVSLEALENRMVRELRKLGISTDRQLTVADLSSNFKDYFLRRDDVQKKKMYTLLVYDALTAGRVIQALEQVDISNIGLQRTEISNLEAIRLQMRRKAIERAHAQAKALTEPLGQTLGKAIHISDMHTEYLRERTPVPMMTMDASSEAKTFEPVDLSFRESRVEAQVNVKFALDQ